jgi:hypothetical protein
MNAWRGCASLALLVIALICTAPPKVASETLESALAEAFGCMSATMSSRADRRLSTAALVARNRFMGLA